MELDIVEGPVGTIGAYDVELKGGKLTAKVDVAAVGGTVTAQIFIAIDGKIVFEKLKAAIPGQLDDAVLSVVEAALLG